MQLVQGGYQLQMRAVASFLMIFEAHLKYPIRCQIWSSYEYLSLPYCGERVHMNRMVMK